MSLREFDSQRTNFGILSRLPHWGKAVGLLSGIGVDKLASYLPIFLGHTHMKGDIMRCYAVLE